MDFFTAVQGCYFSRGALSMMRVTYICPSGVGDGPHDVVWNQGQTETGFGNPIRILFWMVHDALSTQLRPADPDAGAIMGNCYR